MILWRFDNWYVIDIWRNVISISHFFCLIFKRRFDWTFLGIVFFKTGEVRTNKKWIIYEIFFLIYCKWKSVKMWKCWILKSSLKLFKMVSNNSMKLFSYLFVVSIKVLKVYEKVLTKRLNPRLNPIKCKQTNKYIISELCLE